MNGWVRFWIGACMVGALTGCGGGGQSEGMASHQELALPAVYRQNCMSCHGNELQGKVGPSLQTVGSRMSEEEIIQVIRDGKGGMPAYGKRLSEEEISSVASWLAEQQSRGEQ
ncbi:c-type cytochrome [Paenibacillus ginsengihumi]|uniref:c-type cytochrome n=1 Tax=Paenibacillus ginsengihumi TaxID=431596 RepID=UPI0003650DB7|nr:cytochrome c [Paenibacillus ginsengihumi]